MEGLTIIHQWPFKLKPAVISNMVVFEIKKNPQTLELELDKLKNWKSTVIFHTSDSPGKPYLHVGLRFCMYMGIFGLGFVLYL